MVTFEGSSDDTVIWTDANGEDAYDNCANEKPMVFYVVDPETDETMAVVAHYFATGCWCFAPGLYEEDSELPSWPVSIVRGHAYSVKLLIEAPTGAVVQFGGDR
jgi:hypothetical protein